jgi:DNA-binding NarL/FixJ family response regulator
MDKDLVAVIIVSNDMQYREKLNDYLFGEDFIEVVGDADCGEDALELIMQTPADLVIVALSSNDFDFPRQIRLQSQVKMLILSAFGAMNSEDYFWEIGADGYCPADLSREELVSAIWGTIYNDTYQCPR